MKENGLLDAGYEYLNLMTVGVYVITKQIILKQMQKISFRMKSLVSKIHNWFAGELYRYGKHGCHHPFAGSWPFYYQDAIDFSNWGIDYVKFDY